MDPDGYPLSSSEIYSSFIDAAAPILSHPLAPTKANAILLTCLLTAPLDAGGRSSNSDLGAEGAQFSNERTDRPRSISFDSRDDITGQPVRNGEVFIRRPLWGSSWHGSPSESPQESMMVETAETRISETRIGTGDGDSGHDGGWQSQEPLSSPMDSLVPTSLTAISPSTSPATTASSPANRTTPPSSPPSLRRSSPSRP
jgi:hypothetical protein